MSIRISVVTDVLSGVTQKGDLSRFPVFLLSKLLKFLPGLVLVYLGLNTADSPMVPQRRCHFQML